MMEWIHTAEAWLKSTADTTPRLAVAGVVGLLVWALVWVTVRLLLKAARRLVAHTETNLDDELLGRIESPLRWIGPVIGAHAAAGVAGAFWVAGAAEVVEGLLVTYCAIAAFEILVVESWLERRQGVHVPALVRQVVIGLVYGCVLLGVAGEVFGIDITPLLATGSVTTVVVGLALQGPLSNLFSGIMLHVERTPNVGDWVQIDGREGVILKIGWRTTRLRLFSGDVLVVPNAALANAQMINFSTPGHVCQRNIPVPVPLDLSPVHVEAMLREVLAGVDGVVLEPPPRVWLTAIDDHCQRYVVKFTVAEFRRHDDIESDFLKGVWTRFHREGIAFPAPHQAIRVLPSVPAAMAGLDPVRPQAQTGQAAPEATPPQPAPTPGGAAG